MGLAAPHEGVGEDPGQHFPDDSVAHLNPPGPAPPPPYSLGKVKPISCCLPKSSITSGGKTPVSSISPTLGAICSSDILRTDLRSISWALVRANWPFITTSSANTRRLA